MSFDIKTEGFFHKFKMSQNELIISCYDYKDYHVGIIRIIVNDDEKEKLRRVLD